MSYKLSQREYKSLACLDIGKSEYKVIIRVTYYMLRKTKKNQARPPPSVHLLVSTFKLETSEEEIRALESSTMCPKLGHGLVVHIL